MKKIRVGIIGAGGILDAHGPAFQANSDLCDVVAISEIRADAAVLDRIHKFFDKEISVYSDYREMLKRSDIDAVDIILPHNLHMPVTVEAANSGKHVLVEKVMARNIYECDRMIEACDRNGVSLVVCHDRRYNSEWAVLKDIIAAGHLGDIFYFKLEHNQNVIFPENTWVRTREGIGGGAIMSCLTHQIDALRWYGGEISSVICMSKTIPERMEGECIGVVTVRMASEAIAHLSINWWTTSNRSENGLWYELTHICGTKGEAYYMSGKGTFLKIHKASDSALFEYNLGQTEEGFIKVEPKSKMTGHENAIGQWLRYLRGEEANILTFGRDSRATVEVAEAAYRSERSGCTVKLPILPEPWKNK